MNTDDELVNTFADNYTAEMSAAPATNDSPEHLLEKVDAYLSMGWNETAIDHIEEFEDRTGIEFSELVDGTVSAHLVDPREE